MSSLSDYVKGLDKAVWTDAKASSLNDIPTTATWTNARVGNLDILAGGAGAAPIQHWQYGGVHTLGWIGNYNITVSITDYLNCMIFSAMDNSSRDFSMTFHTTSNTNVEALTKYYSGAPSNFAYSFTISKFG
jgi:hypothetical protein